MLYLQKTGSTTYQVLQLTLYSNPNMGNIVVPSLLVIDHFHDDRRLSANKLIYECGQNLGYNGRNDIIAACEPLRGGVYVAENLENGE